MITQESPFTGMAAYQVVEAVVQRGERPPWPDDLNPAFAPLVSLAEQCWQTERQLRPSFADVVDTLRDLSDPQSLGAMRTHRMSNTLSATTDESDELEMALKQQRRNNNRVSKSGTAANPRDLVSYTSTSEQDSAVLITGPPKDQLGRMLYFLAQVWRTGGSVFFPRHLHA